MLDYYAPRDAARRAIWYPVRVRVAVVCVASYLVAIMPLRAADQPVRFTPDIRSIFENSCWKCHGATVQLSRLDLRTREAALKGGARGGAIVPGKAEESRLYRFVAGLEKPAMPLEGKRVQLFLTFRFPGNKGQSHWYEPLRFSFLLDDFQSAATAGLG